MHDVVIVSAWHRADCLRKCLDALLAARGIENKEVWVYHNLRWDEGVDIEPVRKLLKQYPFKVVAHSFSDKYKVAGWMWSHWNAWNDVYNSGANFGYFFSDDVVCTPDFFEWHEAVQADGDWFGSTAWRNPQGNKKAFDAEAYYQISFPNEISMGLCLKRDSIKIALQSPPDWCPQERMLAESWKIVMPYVQRCYHIGLQSSNIGSKPEPRAAVDELPNPIPDYGRQAVILKP